MVANMTTYNVLDNRRNIVGTYPEYTKFARYNGGLNIWIPLLVSENRVRFFALSTLEEVEAVRHTVKPVVMDVVFTVEQAPIQGCAEPPVTCTSLAIWRPIIQLPIDQLGHYREGKKGIPGVSIAHSNVLIELTMPERIAA